MVWWPWVKDKGPQVSFLVTSPWFASESVFGPRRGGGGTQGVLGSPEDPLRDLSLRLLQAPPPSPAPVWWPPCLASPLSALRAQLSPPSQSPAPSCAPLGVLGVQTDGHRDAHQRGLCPQGGWTVKSKAWAHQEGLGAEAIARCGIPWRTGQGRCHTCCPPQAGHRRCRPVARWHRAQTGPAHPQRALHLGPLPPAV